MKVFIATPMSAFTTIEYISLQNQIKNITIEFPNISFFSEILNVKNQNNFESPKIATINDISEINNCEYFIMIHPKVIQSSTLFELGIAYSLNKKILILTPDINHLPFMVKELNLINSNVEIKTYTSNFDIYHIFKNLF